MNEVAAPTRRSVLQGLVGSIAAEMISVLPSGDVADIRRLRDGNPASAAFWKLFVRRIEPAIGVSATAGRARELERRWGTILACMAELQGLHAPGTPFGKALAQADVSEARLTKLLRARGVGLSDAARAVSHQLASKAGRSDLTELAQLILSEGERDQEWVRRRIARDYFRTSRSDA